MTVLVVFAACSGSESVETNGATVTTDATVDATVDVTIEIDRTVPGTTGHETTTAPETTAPETTAPSTTQTLITEPAPAEPAAVEWSPVGQGRYDVGVATIVVADPAGVRPLTVEVWFPLDDDVAVGDLDPQRYTLLPGVFYESPTAHAAGADQLAGDGSFPLVAYSHGSGGLRYIHSSYTEALASHGYVVVAPDHTGNTVIDRLSGSDAPPAEISLARPTDIGRVIDAFVDPTHPTAGPYASGIDPDRVAVTGHSFGGFTAIATITGYSNELGEFAPDARVDAIVPLAPAVSTQSLPDDLLATIDVPMMILVGTDDATTPVDPNVTRLWAATEDAPDAVPAYRIELVAAEHQTFTDICAYQQTVPSLTDVPEIVTETIDAYAVEGCSEDDMPAERATEITNAYVIGFLEQVLRAGPSVGPDSIVPPVDVILEAR